MSKKSLNDHIQESAREASILEECIRIVRTFADYLYFNVFFNELLSEKIAILDTYKSISTQDFAIFINSFGRVTNALIMWVEESTYTFGFKSKKGLSDNLISRLDVRKKRALKDFVNDVDDKLEAKYKIEFAHIIIESLRSTKFNQFLSMQGITEQSKVDLTVLYSSSCGFSYPALLIILNPDGKEKIISLKEFPHKVNYNIEDPEIDAGYKKAVVIDIQTAVYNTFLGYASSLLQALEENNIEQMEQAISIVKNMLFFFSNSEDLPLPSDNISSFDKSINFHSIWQAIKISEAVGNEYSLIMSLSGDIHARKFFIQLPTDYSFFSTVINLVRSKEYEAAPGNFIIKHESEIINSKRMNSARKVVAEIEDWQKEALVSKNVRQFVDKAQIPIKDIAEAVSIGAIAYLISKVIDPSAALTAGVTAGILDYIKNIITSGRKIGAR